jgi:YHS domain-containing protein
MLKRSKCHRPCKKENKEVVTMAEDPICNMEVDEQTAEFKSQYGSQTYYFCSEECKEQFELRPEQYARVA